MATLTANITADQEILPVSTSVVTPGSYFTIGSEAILVHGTSRGPTGRAFDRKFWSVERGIAGTTRASHSSGATLTQYYPDAASSGVGAPQQVSLLGPFPIAFDTPGLDDGVVLAELPAGTIVIRAWVIVTTPTSEPEHLLIIAIGGPGYSQSGDGDTHHLIVYGVAEDLTGNFNEDTYAVEPGIGIDANPQGVSKVGMATAEGAVLVALSSDLGTATSGAFDIYALIATPA